MIVKLPQAEFKISSGNDVLSVDKIGNLSDRSAKSILSWILDERYLEELKENNSIKAVFCTIEMAEKISTVDVIKIITPKPMLEASRVFNAYLSKTRVKFRSTIHRNARIHSSAFVQDENVIIEEDVIVEAGAIINSGSVIRRGSIIRSGATIGSTNFNRYRGPSGDIVYFESDSNVIIEEDVEIGVNCTIDLGDSSVDTVIGARSKLHSNVHVSHGCRIGENSIIWGNVFFCGFVTTKENLQVQPNSLISNHVRIGKDVFIGLQSTVLKDVEDNSYCLGRKVLKNKFELRDR